MTLEEMRKKYLGMIEEIDPNSKDLTADPDIAAKQNEVVNQVMFELARHKKIPKYVELEVTEGEIVDFAKIEKKCGYEIYQVAKFGGVDNDPKANGTIFKVKESGTAEIECFVYPERITEKTNPKAYEFELSSDVLEIMPYGIAADLLKSDVSAEYGTIYATEYKDKLNQLDPRYGTGNIYISGGVMI